jgi:hypothetical protein
MTLAKDAVMAMSEQSKSWTVEFKNGQWTPGVVDNPWLPTTKNYFAADAVAKSSNQLKLKWLEWTRVFDMLKEMDARLREPANEQKSGAEPTTPETPSDAISYRVAVRDDEPAILALFEKVASEIPIRPDDPKVEERMKIEIGAMPKWHLARRSRKRKSLGFCAN